MARINWRRFASGGESQATSDERCAMKERGRSEQLEKRIDPSTKPPFTVFCAADGNPGSPAPDDFFYHKRWPNY